MVKRGVFVWESYRGLEREEFKDFIEDMEILYVANILGITGKEML